MSVFPKNPSPQSATHSLLEFKNVVLQEVHYVIEGPEQVKQLLRQLLHILSFISKYSLDLHRVHFAPSIKLAQWVQLGSQVSQVRDIMFP